MDMYSKKFDRAERPKKAVEFSEGGNWISIKSEDRDIKLPSPSYVQNLERQVTQLRLDMENATNQTRQLRQQLNQTNTKLSQITTTMNAIERKLR